MKKIFFLGAMLCFLNFNAQKTTHIVESGENPTLISKKYGMSLEEFYRLNPTMKKDGILKIGDKVLVKNQAKESTKKTETKSQTKLGKITLQSGETLYGLVKKYNISEQEIKKLNPNLSMQVGEEVTLPLEKIQKFSPEPKKIQEVNKNLTESDKKTPKKSSNEEITYTVEQGDTMFGLVNKFGVSMERLLELNPELSNGLKAGKTIKIKKSETNHPTSSVSKSNSDALNIVMMLPFGYQEKQEKYRNIAVEFLLGARLAVERAAINGLKMDLKIVDTGSENGFKNSLSKLDKQNTDLIIGPFFKSNIVEMMDYLGADKIPVVVPFANSEELYKYNNLVIMETADNIYSERIIKEIKEAYKGEKIYIVSGAKKSMASVIEQNLSKSLKNPEIIVVNSASEISVDKNMMTGQYVPVITVLASETESDGKAYTEKLLSLISENINVKAFSMYYSQSFDKKYDELSKTNLVYIVDRKINTDGDLEKEILAQYDKKYCKQPSKYAIIGFDVLNDVLMRQNRGDLLKNMDKAQTHLATKFEFTKAMSGGAYINTGYRVVRLTTQ